DDLHEVVFNWPYTDPNSVIVTGSFDGWSKSHNLTKGPEGFSGSLHIPWQHSISYKYLVDGRWALDDSKPKRVEPGGYVNNFYIAPCKP
ncbi:carbohydrate-binding module family 48 protein, partial [Amanita thiersii Skay4041]